MRKKPRQMFAALALLLGMAPATVVGQSAYNWIESDEISPDVVWVKRGGARLARNGFGTNLTCDGVTTSDGGTFNILMLNVAQSTDPLNSSELRRLVVGDKVYLLKKVTVPEPLRDWKTFFDSHPDIATLEKRAATLGMGFQWNQSSAYNFTTWKTDAGGLTIFRWGQIATHAELFDSEGNDLSTIEYMTWEEAEREYERYLDAAEVERLRTP